MKAFLSINVANPNISPMLEIGHILDLIGILGFTACDFSYKR